MKKLYLTVFYFFILTVTFLLPKLAFSQTCIPLTVSYTTTESRCAATGMVQINASGGSGTYQYKATGPVATNYTSSTLITGLSAGRYLITIKDVVTNCVYATDSITIDGNYQAPSFSMVSTDVTCINGADGTITVTGQSFGRAPFLYKIIAPSASGVGTTNTTGAFTGLISGNYLIQLTDSCGAIQTRNVIIQNYDWWINTYTVSKFNCDSILVTINLKDSRGNVTPSTVFNGYTYGASINPGDTSWYSTNVFKYFIGKKRSVKLFVKDNCGNIKSVTWTDPNIPRVDATVQISNQACSTFTATITGQANLTNPQFCIYDSAKNLLSCNSTGVFTLLPYGTYCIDIRDNCYDTTISRCFTVRRPLPTAAANVVFNTYCKTFTATVTGQANLNNPNYCIYDSVGTQMYCNTTGVFPNLDYGSYCIKIFNDPGCYDTTIVRCFTVRKPMPSAGLNVTISNMTCTTFTASVTDTANLNNPQFCLYTAAHVLIICNTTGVFNNLPYGSYCIDIANNPSCYDTTITRCFTVNRPVPSVGATVSVSNKTCSTFTATITGQVNINNPQYCIYDAANVQLSCNTTGVFTNLPFGTYCITLQNDPACYDTLIKRCFTVAKTPATVTLSAKKSCVTIGTTDIKVTITSGIPVYLLELYSPAGVLIQSITTSATSATFSSVPPVAATVQKYKIVITDQCGTKDSAFVAPVVSVLNDIFTVTPKCPSGVWPNGSADVLVDLTDNNIGGNIVPKIIKKNGVAVTINASSIAGYKYTFLDLGPAVYIFDTYVENCTKHIYDTVRVKEYVFPILSGTHAYQCDNNTFSVGVHVVGGVGPYTYEIIGSVPASPSIVTPPQSSPIFSINTGTAYSLIRLRVVDGCGNASLYDVSVLPLANFLVFADTLECFNHALTLRVDSMAHADYTWYKRIDPNDSIVVGTGPSLYFPNLTPADTGRYFCKIVVNGGCLTKYANYVLTGFCGFILAGDDITLVGNKESGGNRLYWNLNINDIKEYSLEKSSNNRDYKTIAVTSLPACSYLDKDFITGNNYYRLKLTNSNNKVRYSNAVVIKNGESDISVYPNPVEHVLFIAVKSSIAKNYLIEIKNMTGQQVYSKIYTNVQNQVITCPRTAASGSGVYTLLVTDLQTKERQAIKIVFK
ncbi:T9SS type A sorting domain-containing protein [Ferruginibacter sp.]